jgi:argininosuccinate lyase
MFARDFLCALGGSISNLQAALDEFVSKNKQVKALPGYTHMQHAQPISLSDYAGAYKAMLERDVDRLKDIYKRVNVMPLGSCALAGTSLPIDRKFVAKELGFSSVMLNTVDAVSDRDFVIEILNACAILGMHLSRLSEDLIIWSSSEFKFIDIDEAFCTGSSIMPQKKNPDVLELVRGSTGKLYGNLMSVLVLMKGLPLSYNRDMQLDKEPLFDSLKTVNDELLILAKLIKASKLNKESIDRQLKDQGLYATKMAEDLVRKGVAFKDAHKIVGKKYARF